MKTNKEDCIGKLTYANELKISRIDEMRRMDRDYLKSKFKSLKKKFQGIYNIHKFFYFKSSTAELEKSIMLKIVERQNIGKIGEDLLNKSMRFIGVNCLKMRMGI